MYCVIIHISETITIFELSNFEMSDLDLPVAIGTRNTCIVMKYA